jgi:predicted DNA-binding transcriptional regulator AlpA
MSSGDPGPVTALRIPVVRGLRREDAARYVGVSPSFFDEMVKGGRMPQPFRVTDRVVIWDVRDLDQSFEELKAGQAPAAGGWDDYQ